MTRDVNLTSQTWCELIFEGRNKNYGAYILRQKSSDRHLTAVLIVIAAILAVIFSVKLFNRMNVQADTDDFHINRTVVMNTINISDPKPEQQFVQEPVTQPPLKETIKYTAYVPDQAANMDEDLLTMDEIKDSKAIIFTETIEGSQDPDAVNPRDLKNVQTITAVQKPPVEIREFADVMPSYPGGDKELNRYLVENLRYPAVDVENGTNGRVILRFVVGENGAIRDVKVIRSLSATCDKEAIRVVKGMKNWIPGRQNGIAVPVYFTIPVRFYLEN